MQGNNTEFLLHSVLREHSRLSYSTFKKSFQSEKGGNSSKWINHNYYELFRATMTILVFHNTVNSLSLEY